MRIYCKNHGESIVENSRVARCEQCLNESIAHDKDRRNKRDTDKMILARRERELKLQKMREKTWLN